MEDFITAVNKYNCESAQGVASIVIKEIHGEAGVRATHSYHYRDLESFMPPFLYVTRYTSQTPSGREIILERQTWDEGSEGLRLFGDKTGMDYVMSDMKKTLHNIKKQTRISGFSFDPILNQEGICKNFVDDLYEKHQQSLNIARATSV